MSKEKEKIKDELSQYLPEEYKFLTEEFDFKPPFYDKKYRAVFIPPNVDLLELSYEHSEKDEPVLMVFRRKDEDVFALKQIVGKLADKLYSILTNNKRKETRYENE